MVEGEQEDRGRDSLLLLATATFAAEEHRIKVRNLSAGGMMAEPSTGLTPGDRITVALRNIAPVDGKVAWVSGDRFGVAFDQPIDPRAVRSQVPSGIASPSPSAPPKLRPV